MVLPYFIFINRNTKKQTPRYYYLFHYQICFLKLLFFSTKKSKKDTVPEQMAVLYIEHIWPNEKLTVPYLFFSVQPR